MLSRLALPGLPTRLQFSLHSAREAVRARLVPRSVHLSALEAELRAQASRFTAVELNVVLQDGINDADEDLAALLAWGDTDWTILLNPLLLSNGVRESPRTGLFEQTLRAGGRRVLRYSQVAASIGRKRIYPLLRARPC